MISTRHAISATQSFIQKGPGGRSSFNGHTATVFGCSGFLGRYVVNNLAKSGTQIVAPIRGNLSDVRHLKVMGDLGQITHPQFDLRNEAQIIECIRHSDVVYNLIGRDFTTKNFTFDQVNIEGAARIARLCRENNVTKLIHVSALNASPTSTSDYLRTKYLGEQEVKREFPDVTIVRPSTLFGEEDKFYNRMFWFIKLFYLPIPNQRTTVRPVGDVAAAITNKMLNSNAVVGQTVELYGAEYQREALLKFFNAVTFRNANTFKVSKAVYRGIGHFVNVTQMNPILTPDEAERLFISDQLTAGSMTFDDFGMKPYTVEETLLKFIKLYLPDDLQNMPLEAIIKKVLLLLAHLNGKFHTE